MAILTMNVDECKPNVTRIPETNCYCWRCHKPLKPGQKRRWIHLIDGGALLLHPKSESDYISDSGEMGFHPVGLDCAKQIGMEWTVESSE